MAGSRTASRRREAEASEERRNRLLVLATAVVLGLVAIIVGAGLYFAEYRPPREHVATVAGRGYQAAEIVDRATYFMVFEGGASSRGLSGIAEFTIDLLAREQALRAFAPELVGEASDEDVEAELANRLGTLERPEAFATALASTIRDSGLSRDDYFDLVRAQVLRDRLREHFVADVPQSAPQVRLLGARLSTRSAGEALRERVRDGEEFGVVAAELLDQSQLEVDLGWTPLALLAEERRELVAGLEEGDVTDPISIQADLFFDVLQLAEADAGRELTEEQRNGWANNLAAVWIEERELELDVERDLSAAEDQWIADRVAGRLREAFGG